MLGNNSLAWSLERKWNLSFHFFFLSFWIFQIATSRRQEGDSGLGKRSFKMSQQFSLTPFFSFILLSSFFSLSLCVVLVLFARRVAETMQCLFKVATVLAGKLFYRLPVNHSSWTPALLSTVSLSPAFARIFVASFSSSFVYLGGNSPLSLSVGIFL